jgi:hypothetical protein
MAFLKKKEGRKMWHLGYSKSLVSGILDFKIFGFQI